MEPIEYICCQDCGKDLGEKFYSDQLEYCDECYPLSQQIIDAQERDDEEDDYIIRCGSNYSAW